MVFWSDQWKIGNSFTPPRDRFNILYSFAIDKLVMVNEVLDVENVADLFHLPLSEQAFA